MSNPGCRPPVCSFNCCNQAGICPSSQSQCYHSSISNPIWLYLVIGIVILIIIIGSIILLAVFRRRRLRRQNDEPVINILQPKQTVHIEMKEKQDQTPPAPKKNIYVYERPLQEDAISSRSDSLYSTKERRSKEGREGTLENPFQRKRSIRKQLL